MLRVIVSALTAAVVSALAISTGGGGGAAGVAAASAACNGRAEYCTRRWSNVSQLVSHDSPFVGDIASDNQHVSVTAQLALGVRFLQAQTHLTSAGVLSMCHSSCSLLNTGTLAAYLAVLKAWLDANPNEVLTLLLVNGDYLSPTVFATAFDSANITSYAYTPSGTLTLSQWPTLQELIDSGKRLVTFLDYDADTSKVAYLLPEFTYFFETPYDVTNTTAFAQCPIDRPSGASASGRMYLVNHFLDINELNIILIPDEADANTTNSVSSIMGQVSVCESLYGHAPKGVLLDFIDEGSPFGAELIMNGLS
ncbi:hypothetical protein HK405_005299 [Cladochytrium tenue]|nr:hypothetical protein HK405_005299 [Cladochytrium tenue]